MTVIVSIPSAQYTPRTFSRNFNVPANTTELRLTCTREAWPVGAVGAINTTRPDGSYGGGMTFDGGDAPTRGGGIAPASSLSLKVPGGFLPAGQWTADFQILQTINTAVTIERF